MSEKYEPSSKELKKAEGMALNAEDGIAEKIMAETKETREGDADLKKMSKRREDEILEATTKRKISDAKFIKDGAEYVRDPGADKPRLEVSKDSIERIKSKRHD